MMGIRERKMKLAELLSPWIENIEMDIEISGIESDSRQVMPRMLFLAAQAPFDHVQRYIDEAIQKGAVAIIYDTDELPIASVPAFRLSKLCELFGPIASRFYGYPTHELNVIGVTGTNGKTTISYLLTQAYQLLGIKTFYIGTLGVGSLNDIHETGMTTPNALVLQKWCSHYRQQAYEQLVMEVSSHALDQYRVNGVPFKQAIFTNLTHDHLDYHGTIESYAKAKARLFQFEHLESMIINVDDPWGQWMIQQANPKTKVYRIGIHQPADIKVIAESWTLNGMHLDCETPWGAISIHAQLLGEFNVYNILSVMTALLDSGFDVDTVQQVIAQLTPPPGRMEVVSTRPLVVVDYAHTPDALENALKTLKDFQQKTTSGRLFVIFGCGGDRDPYKRPIMGEIASRYAYGVFVTSDNPRHENPHQIIEQIVAGIPLSTKMMSITDRKLAIMSCLEEAHPEDIILIAGKGHENYQIIGDSKAHFSDQEIVNSFFKE